MPTTTSGFSKETFAFLRGLQKNNSKAWFDKHRGDYEEHLLEPAKSVVVDLGERLAALDPELTVEPRINGTIRRLNRDVRFSKDKTPYKDHLDIMFGRKRSSSGGCCGVFFLRLFHDRLVVGAGVHEFGKTELAAYRDAVDADATGKALVALEKKLVKSGYSVGSEAYKRVPRGFDPEHPRARLLRFGSLHASIEQKLPPEAKGGNFPGWCMKHYKKAEPVYAWIRAL